MPNSASCRTGCALCDPSFADGLSSVRRYEIARGPAASARGEDVEFVALRVARDRPRDVALAHVGGRRAEILQARDYLGSA